MRSHGDANASVSVSVEPVAAQACGNRLVTQSGYVSHESTWKHSSPLVVARLRAMRGPGESYRDAILRIAAAA
jgi:hypothetical protein